MGIAEEPPAPLGEERRDGGEQTPCVTFAGTGVLARLREVARAVSVGELARILGVHRNTVARHLDSLVASGLVSVEPSPRTGQRGRPAYLYRATAADASGRREFARLASLLAGELGQAPQAEAKARRLGRQWGERIVEEARLAGKEAPCPLDYLTAVGFEPEVSADRHTVRLRTCPLVAVATEHPAVVCTMHASMVATLFTAHGVAVDDHAVQQFAEPGVCHLTIGPGEVRHLPVAGIRPPQSDCV